MSDWTWHHLTRSTPNEYQLCVKFLVSQDQCCPSAMFYTIMQQTQQVVCPCSLRSLQHFCEHQFLLRFQSQHHHFVFCMEAWSQASGPPLASARREPGNYVLLGLPPALANGCRGISNRPPCRSDESNSRCVLPFLQSFLSRTTLNMTPLFGAFSFPGSLLHFSAGFPKNTF